MRTRHCGNLKEKELHSMVHGIEHMGLSAQDPKRLADWYVSSLGFTVVHAIEERKTYFVRDEHGGMLEIYPSRVPVPPVDNLHSGYRHLAVAVTDFEMELKRLRDNGVSFPEESIVTTEVMKLAFFRDPEGNLLHLVERMRPLF
jgi:glyoxylase I family protein